MSSILTTAAITGQAGFNEHAKDELHAIFDAKAVEDTSQIRP